MSESKFISYSKTVIAGGVGGICLTLTGHPIDSIKVAIQTMQQVDGKNPYKGGLDCAKKIIKKNGIKGLFSGVTPPLTFTTIMFSARFSGLEWGKKLQQTSDNKKLNSKQIFGAGVLAGFTSSFITGPVERIKCILQAQNNLKVKQFNGPIDCIKVLYKQNGIKSLFRGLPITLVRDCPCLAIYYSTYEITSQKLTNLLEQQKGANVTNSKSAIPQTRFSITLLSGAIAGYSYWVLGIPIDIIKSRLQSTVSLTTHKYGSLTILKELIQKEGLKSLYRGTGPVVVRAPIANSFCFLGYEMTKNGLDLII